MEDGIGFWKSDYALVQDCYVHDLGTAIAGASGISLSGGARARAVRNVSEKNSYGSWAAFGSRDVVIEHNIFRNNYRTAISIGGLTPESGLDANNSGFTIRCNVITGNGMGEQDENNPHPGGWAAIAIGSASNGYILGNLIANNYYQGINFGNIISSNPAEATPPSMDWVVRLNKFSANVSAYSDENALQRLDVGEMRLEGASYVTRGQNLFCLRPMVQPIIRAATSTVISISFT